ncbi:unnamed protein product [Chrysoparadoxa australica]
MSLAVLFSLLLISTVATVQGFVGANLVGGPCGYAHRTRGPSCNGAGCLKMSEGLSLPQQASKQVALYDMVYVERLPDEAQTSSGLFIPGKEQPRMNICKVVSFGEGREGENGHVVDNMGLNVGDLVYVKDPYGIGPRDEEFGNRKFSFVRYSSIAAVIPSSGALEADARAAAEISAKASNLGSFGDFDAGAVPGM